jgi:hypothetical protein
MKRFFSHEVIKQATELIMQRSIHMEGVKADMAIAIAERKWNQDSQIPSMGVAQGVNVRREAVTPDVRSEVGGDIWNAYVTNWKVFVYDDRDPIQRRWLLRMADTLQSHETPIVLAAGFSSRKNLFMFQSAFPGLGITAAHPDLITESGVKQLPAMIQFTNAYEQVYTEGYHLAEIEAWESERNERIENAALVSLPQTTTTRIPEAPASTFDPQKPLTEPAPDR